MLYLQYMICRFLLCERGTYAISKRSDRRGGENFAAGAVSEGTVAGRNAFRELLASGRSIDKVFVQRGERSGSITLLIAQALERKNSSD